MKRFFYDGRLQIYMHNFVYVDPEKMAEEDYFPDIKIFIVEYKSMSTPVPFPNRWL